MTKTESKEATMQPLEQGGVPRERRPFLHSARSPVAPGDGNRALGSRTHMLTLLALLGVESLPPVPIPRQPTFF